MNKIEKKEKVLPEERYDKRLFKQAVKAAKEAKDLERKLKNRKKLLKGLVISLSILLISGVVIYVLPLIFVQKSEYTQMIPYPERLNFKDISNEKIYAYEESSISISNINSESVIAFNPKDGDILFKKNEDEKRSIASLTKLMSALVILETFKLDDVIDVSRENIPENLDWQLGLKDGDRISVENVLKSMLISSYNDVGFVIANSYPYGGYEGFIKAMNRKADSLNMNLSHFSNPTGLDDVGNFSTAKDLAILASVVIKYPEIINTVQLEKDVINWSNTEGLISKEILTTNDLLEENKYITGLKTGVTDLAGRCFIGYFVYPNGEELVTVVLNSADRFGDTTTIEKLAKGVLKP